MCIKVIDMEQYEIVSKWWKAHNFPIIPPQTLPTTGFVSYDGEKPIVAGFLFIPQSGSIGWVEWIVKNPESTKEELDTGYDELMATIDGVAKKNGILALFTSGTSEKYLNRMKTYDYQVSDTGATNMIKILGGV